jgi:hypothetical protein
MREGVHKNVVSIPISLFEPDSEIELPPIE